MFVEALVPATHKLRHRAGLARYFSTDHGAIVDAGTVVEVPAACKPGKQIVVELWLNPMHDAVPNGQFVLAIIRDVSERAEADRRLRELQDVLQALVNLATEILGADKTARLGCGSHGADPRCNPRLWGRHRRAHVVRARRRDHGYGGADPATDRRGGCGFGPTRGASRHRSRGHPLAASGSDPGGGRRDLRRLLRELLSDTRLQRGGGAAAAGSRAARRYRARQCPTVPAGPGYCRGRAPAPGAGAPRRWASCTSRAAPRRWGWPCGFVSSTEGTRSGLATSSR